MLREAASQAGRQRLVEAAGLLGDAPIARDMIK